MSVELYDDPVDPADIYSYVALGPNSKAEVTVHKRTFDVGIIIAVIIGVIILIVILVLSISYSNRVVSLPPAPPPTEIVVSSGDPTALVRTSSNLDDAASFPTQAACETAEHTSWITDRCVCEAPFYGESCSRERSDPAYQAVGIADPNDLEMTVLDNVVSNGKSFAPDSCSRLCDSIDRCIGFVYPQTNMCTLLTDKVVVPSTSSINYSERADATLYLRDPSNLHFSDRIFLAYIANAIPERYWLVSSTPYYRQIAPRTVTKLSFFPNVAIVSSPLTGIYSRKIFDISSGNAIIANGQPSQYYIHRPGEPLKLPPHWKYDLPLYVGYV